MLNTTRSILPVMQCFILCLLLALYFLDWEGERRKAPYSRALPMSIYRSIESFVVVPSSAAAAAVGVVVDDVAHVELGTRKGSGNRRDAQMRA